MASSDVAVQSAPPDSHPPRIWSKVFRLAGLALLLIVVLGLFLESIANLDVALVEYLQTGQLYALQAFTRPVPERLDLERYRDSMWNKLADEITTAEQGTAAAAPSLALKINVADGVLRCEYVVTGPSALIAEFMRYGNYQTDALVQQMLGAVLVNGDPVHFSDMSPEISAPDKPAILHIRSAPTASDGFAIELDSPPKTRHLKFANKQIEVAAASVQASEGLELVSSSKGSSRYKFPGLYFGRPTTAVLDIDLSGANQPKAEPLAKLMERSGLMNLPILGDLAEALLATAPYILLLILVLRYLPGEDAWLYRTFVALVLALRFGVSFLASMRARPFDLVENAPWIANLIRRATGLPAEILTPYSVTWLLITLFAGLLWPLLVLRSRKVGMLEMGLPAARSRIALALAAIATLASLLFWIHQLRAWPEMPQALRAFYLCALVGIVLFWLLWELFPGGRAVVFSIAGFIATAFLAIVGDVTTFLGGTHASRILSRTVAAAIVLVFGVPLALAVLRVSLRVIRSRTLDRLFARRWVRWSFALVIALPTTWLIDPAQIWAGAVWQLAYNLFNFLLFVLMIVLLRILREASPSPSWPHLSSLPHLPAWPHLPDLAVDAGIVLALTAFYSSTSIYFYFPIPLVLGYVMLRWFLLVPPMKPAPSAAVRHRWKDIAATALEFHRTERLDNIARKGLEKKLAQGDLTWLEYQDRIAPVDLALAVEKRTAAAEGHPLDPLLFSYGTNSSEWDSGCTAAIYSLFFALPWILLSLRDVLKSPNGGSYVLLSFLGSASMIVARWTLYGFFFGYFYAYIRGKNGFEKAFSFWFTLVLPSVLASLLSLSLNKASLAPLLFWAAQVFLHCLLLGLFAGELQALWKAGLGWRQLLVFYNLTSLGAWGSSLVLGLGAAITAALSSSLQSLIAEGLKYVGSLPQGPLPGK